MNVTNGPQGIGTRNMKLLAFALGAPFGGVAGALFGAFARALRPEILRDVAVPLRPTLFGHVLLDPEVLRMLLLSRAMILMMLLRPAGMIPAPARYCHDHQLSATLKREAAK